MKEQIVKSLIVAAQVTGTNLSEDAIIVMASKLEPYGEKALKAIDKAMDTEEYKLTLASIMKHLRQNTGHPDAEIAWAHIPKHDSGWAYVTSAMMGAYGAAESLIEAGDMIGARMAFKAAYDELIKDSEPDWFLTGGYGEGLETQRTLKLNAIEKARSLGWITEEKAKQSTMRLQTESGSSSMAKELHNTVAALKLIPQQERAENATKCLDEIKQKLLTSSNSSIE